MSEGMEAVTVTSIYLSFVWLVLNSKLFLDLFVCLNVSLPLFSCKGLRRWPLSLRWPEEWRSLPLLLCPFVCALEAGQGVCDGQRGAGQSCWAVLTLKSRVSVQECDGRDHRNRSRTSQR